MIADGTSIDASVSFSGGRWYVTPAGGDALILPDCVVSGMRTLNGVTTAARVIYRGGHWYVSVDSVSPTIYADCGDAAEDLRLLV